MPNRFFGHFWSLSVEEQFYLFYPAIMVFACVARLRKLLIASLFLFPLARLLVSIVFADMPPPAPDVDANNWRGNAVYQFSFAQFDSFAAGALLAISESKIRASRLIFPMCAAATLVGLILYLAFYAPLFGGMIGAFRYNIYGHGAEIAVYSVLTAVAVTLMISILVEFKPISMILGSSPFRYVGRISYGVYVWHFPISVVILYGMSKWAVFTGVDDLSLVVQTCFFAIFMALTIIISHLSYRFFERPMMRYGAQFLRERKTVENPVIAR